MTDDNAPLYTASEPTIDLLFFGDIVGRPGRQAVKHYLGGLSRRPDVVIANAENTSHGFGLTEKNYRELLDGGVDILTGGNHIWDNKNIFEYVYSAQSLVRPHNMSAELPGTGARVFDIRGVKVGVINLIGQVFMGPYNSPWDGIEALIQQMQYETPILFVDFHAEATAEKIAFAHFISHLGVSAMVGTHTHVQTADNRILNHRMGYVTDAGFNGAHDSVIGMRPHEAIQRLKSQLPARLEIASGDRVQVNAVRFTIETRTGICTQVQRVNEVFSQREEPAA